MMNKHTKTNLIMTPTNNLANLIWLIAIVHTSVCYAVECSCSGLNRDACQNVEGCYWIYGGNYTTSRGCSGIPTECVNNIGAYSVDGYKAPNEVESTHDISRFGHSNDFDVLLNAFKKGGQFGSDQEDYIVGTTAASIFILFLAVFWFLVLLLFRCLGQGKVGFLAGFFQHFVPSLENISSNSDVAIEYYRGTDEAVDGREDADVDHGVLDESFQDQDWEQQENECKIKNEKQTLIEQFQNTKTERSFNFRVNAVRAVFFTLGGLLILTLFLFYGKGVAGVRNSLKDTDTVVNYATETTDNSRLAIQSILRYEWPINSRKDQASALARSCAESNSYDGRSISNKINNLESTISEWVSLISERLKEADSQLEKAQDTLDDVQDKNSQYGQIGYWIMVAVSIAMLILVLWTMIHVFVISKWNKCFDGCCRDVGDSNKYEENCCRCCYKGTGAIYEVDKHSGGNVSCCSKCFGKTTTNAIVLPLLIILLLLFWLFSSLTLIAAIAGADFCLQPDQYVLNVAATYKEDMTQEVFDHLKYYISGCGGTAPTDDLVHEFDSFMRDSQSALTQVDSFSTQEIASLCNLQYDQATALKDSVSVLNDMAESVKDSFDIVQHAADCNQVNPMYRKLVHDAICINGVGGLTWVFATMLTIAVMAMLMLTFRAALRPVKEIPKVYSFESTQADEGSARIGSSKVAPTVETPIVTAVSVEKGNMHTQHLQMPPPLPPPSAPSKAEPIILEKRIKSHVLESGITQIEEVTVMQNPDGSISKKTQIRTQ